MRDCIDEPPGDKKSDLELECFGYDFNKLAMRAVQLSYPLNSLSDFLAGLLFVRLIQDYQAVILMTGRGVRAHYSVTNDGKNDAREYVSLSCC
jgi:hypothetical protein